MTRVVAVTILAIELLEKQNTGKDTTRTGRNSIHGWYLLLIAITRRLLCGLCQRHKVTQRSGAGMWISKPCTILHKDMIDRHSQSNMHKEAMEREAIWLSVEHHGGIQQAFQRQVCVQRRALVDALKIVYYLAKQEIPLTTKYEPIFELAIGLGCDHLRELEVGEPMLDIEATLSLGSSQGARCCC